MTPLRERILSALALGPMTIEQLARSLWARATYVQRLLAEMRITRLVRIAGYTGGRHGRPETLWGAA